MKIEFQKLCNLDENVRNPLCFVCHNECQAFKVSDDELLSLMKDYTKFKYLMTMAEMFYKDYFKEKVHLIFLCEDCIKKDILELRKIKDEIKND